jgi:hypothetical protein
MRSWFIAHRRSMPLQPVHSRLRAFLIEQGQSINNDLERSYDEIGIGIREKTTHRPTEADRQRPRKLGRSGRPPKKKRA